MTTNSLWVRPLGLGNMEELKDYKEVRTMIVMTALTFETTRETENRDKIMKGTPSETKGKR